MGKKKVIFNAIMKQSETGQGRQIYSTSAVSCDLQVVARMDIILFFNMARVAHGSGGAPMPGGI